MFVAAFFTRQRSATGKQAYCTEGNQRRGVCAVARGNFCGEVVFRRGANGIALHAAAFLQADERALLAAEVMRDDEAGVAIEGNVQSIVHAAGFQRGREAGYFVVELVISASDGLDGERRCGGVDVVEVEGVTATVFEDKGDGVVHIRFTIVVYCFFAVAPFALPADDGSIFSVSLASIKF